MRVDKDILHYAGFDTGFFARGENICVRQHFGTRHWELCLCFGILILYLTHTKNYTKADIKSIWFAQL